MKTYSLLKALSLQLSLYNFASGFAVAVPEPEPVQGQTLDARDTADDVVLPAGWVFLGCFTDQTTPTRTLATQTTLYGLDVTIEVCINTCIGLGFNYAGVESGFQCFCGDVTNSPGTVVDAGCDTPCAGNDAELCGGPLRISVYVNQAVNGPAPAPTTVPVTTPTTAPTTQVATTPTITGPATVTVQRAPIASEHIIHGGGYGGKGEKGGKGGHQKGGHEKGGHAGKGGGYGGGHGGGGGKSSGGKSSGGKSSGGKSSGGKSSGGGHGGGGKGGGGGGKGGGGKGGGV